MIEHLENQVEVIADNIASLEHLKNTLTLMPKDRGSFSNSKPYNLRRPSFVIPEEDLELEDSVERSQNIQAEPICQNLDSKMFSVQPPISNPSDKSELLSYIQALPEFCPKGNLSTFVNEVETIFEIFENRLTPDLDKLFSFHIRNKIKGEARDYISIQRANNWNDIKKHLLEKYGDSRSEELLVAELTQCVQKKNEKCLDFYSRIIKTFNNLIQNISLNSDPNNPEEKIWLKHQISHYTKLALKIFKNGLLDHTELI